MDDIAKDARFAHTLKDPRFRPNIKQKKVKLDKRFKSMLKDDDFKVKFMDKRGRPVSFTPKENLGRLYKYESDDGGDDDDTSSEEEESQSETDEKAVVASDEEEEDSEDQEEEEEDSQKEGSRLRSRQRLEAEETDSSDEDEIPDVTEEGPDYARGEGGLESSSEEEEQEEDDEEDTLLDHHWNEPDRNAPEAEEITHRLALCNMDWDRIKARDLYVLFSSFVPQGGVVQSVTIYPSEIGKEKMAEEEKLGPREFREGGVVEEGEEGEKQYRKLDRAKLRQYQLNRLTYFYAVIVCDSKDTANKIYGECDSMEYEKSSCRVDLRFIPDDMTFDDTPKDSCTGVSDLSSFKPSTFTTTAFCQAKVQVTWDETNIERLNKTMKKAFTEEDLEADQFKDIIASSEEDSAGEESDSTKKKSAKKKKKKGNKKEMKNYRKLLGLDDETPKKKKKSGAVLPFVGEGDEDDENEGVLTSDLPADSKTKKKKEKRKKEKEKAGKMTQQHLDSEDESEGEDEEEGGEMEFTWEPESNLQKLKKEVKQKLTPWEQYQQKKKEKKKEKKRERKLERMRQKGIEDTTDLGFDDDFFKDDPDIGKMKDKRKGKKKKKDRAGDQEETEIDEKERAALELLVKDDDDNRSHFSLLKLMKEENAGKKKKGKKRKQSDDMDDDNFKVDLTQPRFAGLLTDPDMRIDPNAPEFKKTKAMVTLLEEVSKKRKTVSGML